MKVRAILFKGERRILVGDDPDGQHSLQKDGAITTPEKFRAGLCSLAHLCADGTIKSFREIVGHRDDLEDLGLIEIEEPVFTEMITGLLTDPDWDRQDER